MTHTQEKVPQVQVIINALRDAHTMLELMGDTPDRMIEQDYKLVKDRELTVLEHLRDISTIECYIQDIDRELSLIRSSLVSLFKFVISTGSSVSWLLARFRSSLS